MNPIEPIRRTLDGEAGARLVVVAQLIVLVALSLNVAFIVHTTGGTLFLAAALAPALIGLAVLVAGGVLIYRLRKAHSLFQVEIYQAGEVIFKEGDPGECAYFIQSGEVEVLRRTDGRDKQVAVLKDGEYFGEMSLLSPNPRNATVKARSVTIVGIVGKDNFLSMMTLVRSAHSDVSNTVKQRAMGKAAGAS